MSIDQAAKASVRLYRWLGQAFPEQFLRAHREEVDLLTEEMILEAAQRHGWVGFLPFVARLFFDLLRSLVAEHLLELRLDLRYGMRNLLQSKLFTVAAIFSLGLGISVVTTIYSQVESMVLQPVPGVSRPQEVVRLQNGVSYPNYEYLRDRSGQFREVTAYLAPVPFMIEDRSGRSERSFGHLVSDNYFRALEVESHLGRLVTGEGDTVVISHRLWQRRFAAAPDIVGRTVRVNRRALTIAGVTPPGFLGASPMLTTADLFVSVHLQEFLAPELGSGALGSRKVANFQVAGRLREGLTVPSAQAALDAQLRQLEQQNNDPGKDRKGRRATLLPGGRLLPIRDEDTAIMLAMPVVLCALMLWTTCANLATVLLARAVHRRKEIALRLALGASRGRIIRQLLTESTMLALAGGAVGVVLALWSMTFTDLYRPLTPDYITLEYFKISLPAVFVTVAVSLLTGILFGLAPALQATRADVGPALKGGVDRLPTYRWWSTRNMLILQQVAGALALLLISGIIVLGFQRNIRVDLGFDAANLWQASLDPRREGFAAERTQALADALRNRLRATASVVEAGYGTLSPMAMGDGSTTMTTGEDFDTLSRSAMPIRLRHLGPGYLETLRVRLKSGRLLTTDDAKAPLPRLVVNQTLVEQRYRGRDPVGRILELDGKRHEIVGLIDDVKLSFVVNVAAPIAYTLMGDEDYAQPTTAGLVFLVRVPPGVDGGALVREAVRQTMSEKSPGLTVFHAATLQVDLDNQAALTRLGSYTYAGIGVFALLLAAVGLAGVTAYAVVLRTKEIGIRMALGAPPAKILGLVMREGFWLTIVGSCFGMGAAFALVRWIGAYMDVVATVTKTTLTDPLLLFGAPLLLVGLTLLSCYGPARRSMRISPVTALREE